MFYTKQDKDYEKRKQDWAIIEDLVLEYQKQFNDEYKNNLQVANSSAIAAEKLLDKFENLFKKYLKILKTGQIDWNDKDAKMFIYPFINDPALQRALKRYKQKATFRHEILANIDFIAKSYGSLTEDEIKSDLKILLLTIAKRYKPMGKNFCSYVYNAYRYEVARHIKSYLKNPLNFEYKKVPYEDFMNSSKDSQSVTYMNDTYCENELGIPDDTWISGTTCSEIFEDLTNTERFIIIKYYLEEWNDSQIADYFGFHINTVNQKRRKALSKIAGKTGFDLNDIKRTRKSGKKAFI